MAQRPRPNSNKARPRASSATQTLDAPGTRKGRAVDSRQPVRASTRPKARRETPSTPRFTRQQRVLGGIMIAVLVALGGLTVAAWLNGSRGTENVAGASGAGQYPWEADPPGLQTRLASAGLPALTTEGEALHIHQHLDLYIHGQQATVPADIGIDQSAGILSPIHTHDTSGVIHVESPVVQDFFLRQLFQVWGVSQTATCIGSYCTDAQNKLQMWVNGQAYSGDPGSLKLEAHQEIVIAYGTSSEVPSQIPSTYAWNGL